MKNRLIVKTLFGLGIFTNWMKRSALEKSINKLDIFHEKLIDIMISRILALEFSRKYITVQIKWRGFVYINNIRKSILSRKWKKVLENLIKQYRSKGKQHSLVLKLQSLPSTKSLDEYFDKKKKIYYKAIREMDVIYYLI